MWWRWVLVAVAMCILCVLTLTAQSEAEGRSDSMPCLPSVLAFLLAMGLVLIAFWPDLQKL